MPGFIHVSRISRVRETEASQRDGRGVGDVDSSRDAVVRFANYGIGTIDFDDESARRSIFTVNDSYVRMTRRPRYQAYAGRF